MSTRAWRRRHALSAAPAARLLRWSWRRRRTTRRRQPAREPARDRSDDEAAQPAASGRASRHARGAHAVRAWFGPPAALGRRASAASGTRRGFADKCAASGVRVRGAGGALLGLARTRTPLGGPFAAGDPRAARLRGPGLQEHRRGQHGLDRPERLPLARADAVADGRGLAHGLGSVRRRAAPDVVRRRRRPPEPRHPATRAGACERTEVVPSRPEQTGLRGYPRASPSFRPPARRSTVVCPGTHKDFVAELRAWRKAAERTISCGSRRRATPSTVRPRRSSSQDAARRGRPRSSGTRGGALLQRRGRGPAPPSM